MTSWMLLVCGIGGARLSREGGERRSPAPPQEAVRFFCCAVGSFLEGRAQCSDGAFGTSGVPLVCRIGGVGHCAKAGSVAPLHPLKRQQDSFAAQLDVSIEGRACWFAFDELDVACLRNRRCATVARGRGASLPCIPSRGGEVLLLCCWEFLLRVKRVSLLMTSWMLLVCKLEVCDRRVRAGSVAPLRPLKGRRGSFAARLSRLFGRAYEKALRSSGWETVGALRFLVFQGSQFMRSGKYSGLEASSHWATFSSYWR